MAKAKKPRSEKQLANDKRLKEAAAARREAKSQNKNLETKSTMTPEEVMDQTFNAEAAGDLNPHFDIPLPEKTPEEVDMPVDPKPKDDTIVQGDYGDLLAQIRELKEMQWTLMRDQLRQNEGEASTTTVANGRLIGTVEKYSMDANSYADPRERLIAEPKLKRFAFPLNYELGWEISESAYETIDKVRMKEPKFTLTLVKIWLDEDTGEDTGNRYDICRMILHEDPEAALVIAREQGLEVQEDDQTAFLNEMRYLRMRDWLLECFYPPKPNPEKLKRDMVVNGKLVQVWTKNVDVDSGKGGITKMDWDNLPKIKF